MGGQGRDALPWEKAHLQGFLGKERRIPGYLRAQACGVPRPLRAGITGSRHISIQLQPHLSFRIPSCHDGGPSLPPP